MTAPSFRHKAARATALASVFIVAAASAAPMTLNLRLPAEFEYRPTEPRLSTAPADGRKRVADFALALQDDGLHLTPQADALFHFAGHESATQTVSIRTKDVRLDAGALDLTAALGRQSLADDVTVDRLMAPGPFEAESVMTAYTGIKGTWLKKISFAGAAALSQYRSVQNPAFRGTLPADALHETQAEAFWLSSQADFGDAKTLKWTTVASLGVVDEAFRAAGSARLRPEGANPITGERMYAMTRVKSGDVAISASAQSLARTGADVASQRVTLEHAWGNASFLTREAVQGSRETASTGYALELLPGEVAPEAGEFLPSLLSFELRDERKTWGTTPPETFRTMALDAAWSTAAGETFVSWWRSAPRAANAADELFDATQSLNVGDWRLSVGLSHMAFRDGDTRDTTLAAHGRIVYAPRDWLNVELGLDRMMNETLAEFDDPFAVERLDLMFALDAAPLLRDAFAINAIARIEARQTIDRFTPFAATTTDTTAVAATFAAPL
jgi:hypothetical protein